MSMFENVDFSMDEPEVAAVAPGQKPPVDSPFVVLVDSNEHAPFAWQVGGPEEIVGDYRDDYAPIRVRTTRRRLEVADYAIEGVPGIAVERKSKADLFGSVASKSRRDNFVQRLRRMQETLRYGAIVVECYPDEILFDPPAHTSFNPKAVYRTALSWSQQFPFVHWHFCMSKEWAAQVTYRLLEFFFRHEADEKYKLHNRIVDNCLGAFQEGIIARKVTREIAVPYPPGHPFRLQWLRGWGFYSVHFAGGDLGNLADEASWPQAAAPRPSRKKSGRRPKPEGVGHPDANRELEEAIKNIF